MAQLIEQVDHLGLDGHVQRGHRFIGNDQLRFHHHGPRHADPLALAA